MLKIVLLFCGLRIYFCSYTMSVLYSILTVPCIDTRRVYYIYNIPTTLLCLCYLDSRKKRKRKNSPLGVLQ
ncbi:hypothetical protein BDF14DRAFT_1795720 [Spinellus fusiger]|nr:hypothetical protein BDF14DRAFT_1795720 [Spinellus fusiger]